jgi:predicted DNA-binding WGR domain protein
MRRFELRQGTSSKFWEVDVEGSGVTVRFGRIGTNGQVQTKSHATAEKANRERDKLIKEKAAKGYVEVAKERVAEPGDAEQGWVVAENGYDLALRDGKILCRNAKGQVLSSVPKDVKAGAAYAELEDVRGWLGAHAKECAAEVEAWMLRSLPAPRAVLAAVFEDDAWRAALENAVVVPGDLKRDASQAGFFRGVDPEKGIGLVTLDGETVWTRAETITIPHPVLLEELDDFRALAAELGLVQGVSQLFRETFARPAPVEPTATSVTEFQNGKFQMLQHALGVARKHGFRVSGGNALCRVWHDGKVEEARFWIGAEDVTIETYTDELVWVDDKERTIKVADVHPVAYSEGMRMASLIYAARVLEKTEEAGT